MFALANYLTSSSILLAYLGFAGGWGALFRRTQKNLVLSLLYGLLLMLPSALALPWMLPIKLSVWGFSLLVAVLFNLQPAYLPVWLWHRNFAFGYFGVLMLLILGWTAFTGQPILWLWIGLPAGVTAVLLWLRAFGVYIQGNHLV